MACFVVVFLASNVGAAQKADGATGKPPAESKEQAVSPVPTVPKELASAKGAKPSTSASQTGEWQRPVVRFS
jgi:hypothetical protein